MNLVQRMNEAPRCSATSKRSRRRCRAPAVKGWTVCRFHGARGGVPEGNKNALKSGRYTAQAIAMRKAVTTLMRKTHMLRGQVDGLLETRRAAAIPVDRSRA